MNLRFESHLADLDKRMHFLSKFLTSQQLKKEKHDKHEERDKHGHHDKHGPRDKHGRPGGKHHVKRGKERLKSKWSPFGLKYKTYPYLYVFPSNVQCITYDIRPEG